MNVYDNLIMPDIEAGEHDRELGEMTRNPDNAGLTASEIKDKLCHKLLTNMAQVSDIDGFEEEFKACLLVFLFFVLIAVYLITPPQ